MEVLRPSIITVLIFSLLTSALTLASENVHVFSIEKDSWSSAQHSGETVTVMVNLQQSLNTISSHFVGITIDAGLVRWNWSSFNFSSAKVQTMAKALSPSYFRLGGTSADQMIYDLGDSGDNSVDTADQDTKIATFNMTAKQWETVYNFSQAVGWEFIMDLNALQRHADGSWNPDNARQLLQYSAKRNFTIAGFELGNEYNIYKEKFNTTLSPSQLAKDVASLKTLLAQFPAYATSFLIGPETTSGLSGYFTGFLSAGGSKVVRAASFHQYYFAGSRGHVSDFLDVRVMDELAREVDKVLAEIRVLDPQLPVWLSETSSSYDSGTPNVSDRFVAGFLWLDKLGVCASRGVQSVIRQAFYGGHYSLVNATLDPNPDFWLTVLYKRLVGGAVFNVSARSDVRVYAACANAHNFNLGSLVLYMLNPNAYHVMVHLPQFTTHRLLLYSLTAGDDILGLLSRFTSLNGVELKLVNNTLPDFIPQIGQGDVTLEPYSFMFVVVNDARVTICMEQL